MAFTPRLRCHIKSLSDEQHNSPRSGDTSRLPVAHSKSRRLRGRELRPADGFAAANAVNEVEPVVVTTRQREIVTVAASSSLALRHVATLSLPSPIP